VSGSGLGRSGSIVLTHQRADYDGCRCMVRRVSGATTSHTEHSRAATICGKVVGRGKDRDGRRAWISRCGCELGMQQYERAFRDNAIDAEVIE
jgi:hypothetical protein